MPIHKLHKEQQPIPASNVIKIPPSDIQHQNPLKLSTSIITLDKTKETIERCNKFREN